MESDESVIADNVAMKKKVMVFISEALTKLHKAIMKDVDPEMINITIGVQVHNILLSVYDTLMLRHSGSAAKLSTDLVYEVIHLGSVYSIDKADAMAIIKETADSHGLRFQKYEPGDPENWYPIGTILVNYLAGFGFRMKELQLNKAGIPLLKITIRQSNGRYKEVSPTDYGLEEIHHLVLDGSTFPPEKRLLLSESLGPLTALIDYVNSEREFAKEWKIAVKRRLEGKIPNIDLILALMYGKPAAEIAEDVKYIGDIVVKKPWRHQRMHPPPNAFAKIFGIENFSLNEKDFTRDEFMGEFNFRGHGGMLFYKIFCGYKWEINGDFTEKQARQIVYHSYLGTIVENMRILKQITEEVDFLRRSSFDSCFATLDTSKNVCKFQPILQKMYCEAPKEELPAEYTESDEIFQVWLSRFLKKCRESGEILQV